MKKLWRQVWRDLKNDPKFAKRVLASILGGVAIGCGGCAAVVAGTGAKVAFIMGGAVIGGFTQLVIARPSGPEEESAGSDQPKVP